MSTAPTNILLVEADAVDAGLIKESLAETVDRKFRVEWVPRLSKAIARLGKDRFEVVLLDLTLPDSQGGEAFDRILETAPDSLILILGTANDEDTARQAVQRGADDYLIKDHVDAHWLPRTLHYLIERKVAREALRNSEARFRAMSDASPLGIFVSDAQGNCIYANAAYHKISGLSFEQALGTNWSMAIHPEDRQHIVAEWRAAAGSHEPFQTEARFLQKDGSVVWTRLNAVAVCDGENQYGRVQTVEDITERKATELKLQQAQESLFEEKERAQVTLNSIGDAVLTTNLAGEVTYMNQVAETMTGWSLESALGRPLTDVFRIIDGSTRQTVANPAQRAIAENQTVGLIADCVLVHRDGSESAIEDSAAPIHNRENKVVGAVLVFHDASASRAVTQKMAFLAQHDFLTGLPNRLLLTERLTQAIGLAHRHRKQVALLFLDLDYFKNINDSLGHASGDELLQSVASRLKECVRTTDTVSRLGGDEFVILLAEIEQPRDAAHIAEKILAAVGAPQFISGHELHVTLSIGISIYPDDSKDADTTMKNADTAMYCAKADGRNNFRFFKNSMENQSRARRLAPGVNA